MALTAAVLKVDVIANTSDAEKGVAGFGDKLNKAAKTTGAIGGVLTAAITAPLIGIAAAALSSAAAFEQNMNVLQQVLGASTNDMAAMQAEALRLGAVTSFSAGEAAEAMLELGKAGMDTNEIMASIGGVLDLAAAGGIGLADAATYVATSLNAFGLEASEATRIANLFAAGANASSADVADLAKGVQNAGFAFAAAGFPIEDLVASMAILTNVGLTASDGSTALKNAIMQMISPTQQAADLAKELGLNFFDAAGKMLSLPTILDNINAATAGMTDQQRNAALATLFMSDGMKALIPLLDQGSAGFNAMVDQVTVAGAATEVAGARMKGLSGGIEYLKGSIDSFLIGAALPFTEQLGNLARGAGDMVSAFGALPQPIIDMALALGGAAAAAGPLMLAVSGLLKVLSLINPVVAAVVAVVAVLGAAWVADIGGIQGITASTFASVQAWFTSTLAAAQQLASGISAAFSNTSFPSLSELWQQFQAGDFQAIAETIRNTTYELMVNLDTELNITAQANQLKQRLVDVVNGLGTAISNLDFSGAQANASKMRDGILNSVSSAIDGVDWGQASISFAGMINSLTSAINGLEMPDVDWAGLFNRILLSPMSAAVAGIDWAFNNSAFEGLKTSVSGAIGEIDWGALGTAFAKLGATVSTSISEFFSSITLPKLPTLTLEGFFTGAADIINGMTAAINGQDWEAVGSNFVSTIGNAIKNAFLASAAIAVGIGQAVASAVTSAQEAAPKLDAAFNAWFAQTAASITAAFNASGLSTAFAGLVTAFDTALTGFITGAKTSITAAFAVAFQGLGTVVSGLWSDFTLALPEIDWANYISALEWASYVKEMAWSAFVVALDWAGWVTSLTWTSFVSTINWGSFVPDISWESFIPSFSWGDWIPSLDWSRFIPWLGALGGGAPSGNATGTPYWQGGLSWVGERGPELVNLPRGSRVYNNSDSMAMAGGGVTVNINVASLGSDMDLESMANKVARLMQRKMR